jgi:hypothetical protein
MADNEEPKPPTAREKFNRSIGLYCYAVGVLVLAFVVWSVFDEAQRGGIKRIKDGAVLFAGGFGVALIFFAVGWTTGRRSKAYGVIKTEGDPKGCIVLQTEGGEHLGFMLCSPDLGQPTGDCIFMIVPTNATLFDAPAAKLLFERRDAGESKWQVVSREPLSVVVQSPGLPTDLFVDLGNPNGGRWSVGSETDRQVVGRALLTSNS